MHFAYIIALYYNLTISQSVNKSVIYRETATETDRQTQRQKRRENIKRYTRAAAVIIQTDRHVDKQMIEAG